MYEIFVFVLLNVHINCVQGVDGGVTSQNGERQLEGISRTDVQRVLLGVIILELIAIIILLSICIRDHLPKTKSFLPEEEKQEPVVRTMSILPTFNPASFLDPEKDHARSLDDQAHKDDTELITPPDSLRIRKEDENLLTSDDSDGTSKTSLFEQYQHFKDVASTELPVGRLTLSESIRSLACSVGKESNCSRMSKTKKRILPSDFML